MTAQVVFELQAGLAGRLRCLARAKGSTLFSVLLGIFAATLGRFAGGVADLAIASPVGNRGGMEVEQLIGYFVNTVIFRACMQPPCSFEDLLGRLRQTVVGAFSNASAPYAVVLENAGLDAGAIPAMFVLQDADESAWHMEGLRVEPLYIPRASALFEVTCEMQELPGSNGGLKGLIVYNTNLWTASRAARFADSFQALANAVAEQPAAELHSLAAISAPDRMRVLEWGGHNQRREVATPLIKALLAQLTQPQRQQRLAILAGSRSVSYSEFGARVAALAAALRKRLPRSSSLSRGAEEVLVGLLLGRSVEMAVAMWAVLGAGAAYVPIDPEYPAERIAHILTIASPTLLLCREEHVGLCVGVEALTTEQWPEPAESTSDEFLTSTLEQRPASSLAYVIFTSGSTGRPKGVAVEHRAAANMVREQINLMRISAEDRVLQFFKPAFDGAVQEYLSTPCAGAALVLWDTDEGFGFAMTRHRVSVATLTPSALAVLEPSRLPCLSSVAVAAEACPPALVNAWSFEGRRLVNAYGPSEVCVVATSADLQTVACNLSSGSPSPRRPGDRRAPQPQQYVPIGRPLKGVQCYVFEPGFCRSLQPIGAPGELCLGGVQLARGYFGDVAKTNEKFVTNPLDGTRMYRSGDLVTWLSTGALQEEEVEVEVDLDAGEQGFAESFRDLVEEPSPERAEEVYPADYLDLTGPLL
ncbi:unnamed protein product [Polarella glacialis]|uniref:Uncharacterized protein n=1 Tax=Polarella glacialis TaxID=89957 RepID=A0A813FHX0_POLGL|nr:unnamed protein product [Polarella glacialis]